MDLSTVVVETGNSTDTGQGRSEHGSLVYSRCVGWMDEALNVSSVLGISVASWMTSKVFYKVVL